MRSMAALDESARIALVIVTLLEISERTERDNA
jgi:hypothetical protein